MLIGEGGLRIVSDLKIATPRYHPQSAFTNQQSKKPAQVYPERAFLNNPGDFLLSYTVTRAVPSAPAGLTSVFGMGTGVTCRQDGKMAGMKKASALADWPPEEIALGKRWVDTWQLAAADLERIRRREIRELDTYENIRRLCGPADYTRPPYAPKPWSGLVEQQRWFKKAAGSE